LPQAPIKFINANSSAYVTVKVTPNFNTKTQSITRIESE